MRRKHGPSLALLALLAAGACSPSSGGGDDPEPATLTVLVPDPVAGCDPRQALHVRTAAVVRHLYEGLTAYDAGALARGEVVLTGGAAQSWEVTADGCRYRFRLRPDARFHDDACFPGWQGRPVQAEDVVFSLSRWLAPATPEPAWRLLQAVRGAADFHAGRARRVAGLAAPDPRTVVLELAEEDPFLLHKLAGPAGWILPPEAAARYGDDLSRHPVGSGPFRLASYDPPLGLTLVRHEGYGRRDAAGRSLPRADVLVYRYGDPLDALLGPRRYDLVYANAGTFDRLRPGQDVQGWRVLRRPRLNCIFYSFLHEAGNPWLADVRLRQALAMLLPRPADRPDARPADQLLPPSLRAAAGLTGTESDLGPLQATRPEEGVARLAALRAAGVPVPGVLRVAVDPRELADIRLLRDTLAAAGVALEYHDRDGLGSARWRPHLARDGWIADVPDPRDFYALFWSRSPANRSGFADPEYDRFYLAALRAATPSALQAACRGMEGILRARLPALWLRYEIGELIAATTVSGAEHAINSLVLPALEHVAPGAR